MNWFYAENSERKGPVPDDQLQSLVHSGVIQGDTLVWREGMAEWRPWREAAPGTPPPLRTVGGPVAAVRYGGFWLRALAVVIDGVILGIVQGALFAGMFGGSVIRSILDAVNGDFDPSSLLTTIIPMAITARLGGFLITGAYYTTFWVQSGATPGKSIVGLKVISENGGPITWGQAIGRYFGTWLSGAIMGIGFLMAAFDEQKRTLHDRLAGTRVIETK